MRCERYNNKQSAVVLEAPTAPLTTTHSDRSGTAMANSQSTTCKRPKRKSRWLHWRERFWLYVEKTDTCWLWHGPMDGVGYGAINTGDRRRGAHRVSYEMANGPIPDGLFVCHTCDVRNCVNPSHLFVGTARDNALDCWLKGRSNRKNGHVYKTHCVHGHPLSGPNADVYRYRGKQRMCRPCRRAAERKHRERKCAANS